MYVVRAPLAAAPLPHWTAGGGRREVTPWTWGSHGVAWIYEALRAQGTLGCMVAVFVSLQLTHWGLRLTDRRKTFPALEAHPPWGWAWFARARMRRGSRIVGGLLQAAGSVLTAITMVALVRALSES